MHAKEEFLLELNPSSDTPLFWQLYQQLRQKILTGALEPGTQLPPSRKLAQANGLGRVTVTQAYAQLRAEGYVVGKQGAGTFVASDLIAQQEQTAASTVLSTSVSTFTPTFSEWGQRVAANTSAIKPIKPRAEIDFGFGRSFPHIFPYDIWRRLLARYLSTDDVMLSRYGSAAGFYPLREAIAAYLARQRGVNCLPEQVVIVNGAQQAIDILGRLFLAAGDEVIVETPGYQDAFALFSLHGAQLVPIRVDDQGLPVDQIPTDCNARIAFITPSNQFPRGGTLPLQRRLALLQWAKKQQALIFEDDYDGELRYDGRPLGTLYSLDRDGRVIYLGTFSKVLFPALRLGYVVLPPQLVAPFVRAKGLVDRGAPTLTQAAIADFIAEGYFERHLRQLRKAYGKRRLALVEALKRYLEGKVRVTAVPAGLHVMLYLPDHISETEFIAAANKAGVGIYPGAEYHLEKAPPPSILMGFSGLTEAEIEEGVRRLGHLLV